MVIESKSSRSHSSMIDSRWVSLSTGTTPGSAFTTLKKFELESFEKKFFEKILKIFGKKITFVECIMKRRCHNGIK